MAYKSRTTYTTGLKKCLASCQCPECRKKKPKYNGGSVTPNKGKKEIDE